MVNRGLDDLQRRAADLMISGWKITTIANYLEVSRPTLYAWKKLPEWQEYIKEQSGEALNARGHRIQRILDLALEQIEGALIDPEIAPLKRAELALKWLSLLRENMGDASFKLADELPKRVIDQDTIKMIREKVYGIYDPEPAPKKGLSQSTIEIIERDILGIDPEVPNTDAKILEPGLDGTILDESE